MAHERTLGVYTPYLQGFFYGELVCQLQQYALLKGYRCCIIKTGGFGKFRSNLHIDELDSIVVVRNAVHPDFAKSLLERGKKLVSISYDYFPLPIPVVGSDNVAGVEMAFNFLLQKGHTHIAFVGDLSLYDVRKRYEAYCDQQEINALGDDENCVFSVSDSLFSGGYEAALEYVAKGCKATGVICASSLTSIGFRHQLKEAGQDLDRIDVVGFEAISLVPVTEPDITMVDLNLHLFAYQALRALESEQEAGAGEHKFLVEPKLITPSSEFLEASNAFLATSTELLELHDANYMKSVLTNLYEWPRSIVNSGLDHLMMLQPVFEKQMQKACLGRFLLNKEGKEFIRVNKVFSPHSVQKFDNKDFEALSEAETYPPPVCELDYQRYDSCIHVPIFLKGQPWRVLSIYGDSRIGEGPSSFSAFCDYIDAVITQLVMRAYKKRSPQVQSAAKMKDAGVGSITWIPDSNDARWNIDALNLLGFNSELEQNIYQHMDLIDRIHPDDEAALSEALLAVQEKEFEIKIRLLHKNKSYAGYSIEGKYDLAVDAALLRLSPAT
ncbi:substrate-binding domain-containing protein [Agaribacterium haliotis]|uniref:substrate-binding domain-containing protein n=1 Tax=Agaribacterium haliotis TaxID=2013869 RepID=UPI000BB5310C|nr:substrate-binding domain-containing protein [Agaribacterium haliotis]